MANLEENGKSTKVKDDFSHKNAKKNGKKKAEVEDK